MSKPLSLVGDWTCIDRGGAVDGGMLDFLQYSGTESWMTLVYAEVIYP